MTFAPDPELDRLSIDTIRTLAMDAVQRANSGHPGAPMGMAPMAFALWTRFMHHNPADPRWFDRDRFVLSAGHASMLLYSLLHITGYDLSLEQIRQFRQWGSLTPGHPERGLTPGVEVTTGPLGAGFAMGVGMAIAERYLAARFNRPGHEVIDHRTFAIVSDGDLMEGVASEAASLAGHLALGKLTCLYDDNSVTIDGAINLSFSEGVAARFEAYGWHVERVDGDDIEAAAIGIRSAIDVTDRPSLVVARTTIAYGSPGKAGSSEAHGAALGVDEVRATRVALGWDPDSQFTVPDSVSDYGKRVAHRGERLQADWTRRMEAYAAHFPDESAELRMMIDGRLPDGWDRSLPDFPRGEGQVATRKASGAALNAIAAAVPGLIGGSADLAGSNETLIRGEQPMSAGHPAGRNMYFGVREHAMGNILNGMALHGGLIPYAGTFLVFSDYMRPAIRLAAIQHAHVVYVFTHDSIGVGEDGPTHQPIEHLASLRAMPGLVVIRPADANETVAAWRVAMEREGPVVLSLTRQNVPVLPEPASSAGVRAGAYVLADSPGGPPDAIIIGTGSEVSLALEARELLAREGIRARVVSMPSWELFEEQSPDYQQSVLPSAIRARVAVEAAATFGWSRWVGDLGTVVGIDHFGASAPASTLFREFGFTAEHVAGEVRRVVAHARAEAPA
ncbi:MAG: transketolase [Dehalococcoidia bacterium]